jgi:hypothetical protein
VEIFKVDQEQLLAAIAKIAEDLKTDMAAHCATMDAKYEALADSVSKIAKKDAAGSRQNGVSREMADGLDDDDAATQTAADRARSDAVNNSAIAALARSVAKLEKANQPPMGGTVHDFADAQARADAVMRAHGLSAEPPMRSETLVDYEIRLHRKMQPHSAKWKGSELSIIAADGRAFQNVLAEIRSDATEAANCTDGMKPFVHREVTTTLPTGHKVTNFVGNGSIFAQMSRPVRHVGYIGTRDSARHQNH